MNLFTIDNFLTKNIFVNVALTSEVLSPSYACTHVPVCCPTGRGAGWADLSGGSHVVPCGAGGAADGFPALASGESGAVTLPAHRFTLHLSLWPGDWRPAGRGGG